MDVHLAKYLERRSVFHDDVNLIGRTQYWGHVRCKLDANLSHRRPCQPELQQQYACAGHIR
jgi:hypothetical protein